MGGHSLTSRQELTCGKASMKKDRGPDTPNLITYKVLVNGESIHRDPCEPLNTYDCATPKSPA